jgi:hypothetical protein
VLLVQVVGVEEDNYLDQAVQQVQIQIRLRLGVEVEEQVEVVAHLHM